MITQELLKELFHYNPETGIFTRLKSVQSAKRGVSGSKCERGYIFICINGKNYRAHRLAFLYMTGHIPLCHCDHINHDRSDNRLRNLQAVTRQENLKNKSMYKKNTSGTTGVYWRERDKKWRAYIGVKGKQVILGLFDNKNDAIKSRKLAEIEYGYHSNHGASK